MKFKKSSVIFIFATVVLVVTLNLKWISVAHGLERGVDLRLSVQQEYNDNIFFTIDEEIEDQITTLSGGLTFYSNSERFDADLSARVEKLDYQDQDELDATDQFYSGETTYVFTPRWQGGVNVGFSRDSRPDRDVETTGRILESERDQMNGSLFSSYQATENTDVICSYSYSNADYEQDRFSDMTSHQGGLGLDHDWSKVFENTSVQFNLNYGGYEYDSSTINVYSAHLGITKKINEMWALSLSGGARYLESEFELLGNILKVSDHKWGRVWSANLDYQGEFGYLGFFGQHDITPSSGIDGTTERTSLGLKSHYRFAKKSRIGLNVNYHLNKADKGILATNDVDEETWQITPNVKISLLDDLYLVARCQYSQVSNRISDKVANRRYAILKLVYDIALWD